MRTILLSLLLVASAASAEELKPDVKEWTLPNGLDVVYLGVHHAPVVSVQVWYHVGTRDELDGQHGYAHMFEHVMFRGSTHVPPQMHAEWIKKIGGTLDAQTMDDTTAYFQTLPKQYMDYALSLEADRMRGLVFQKDPIMTERDVVKEEKRVRIDNSPFGKAFERFRQLEYTKHPYRFIGTGTMEDLDKLDVDALKKFYDTYYQPNNATVIVVGDVSEDEVRASVEKRFGAYPKAPEPPHPAAQLAEPKQTEPRRDTIAPGQAGLLLVGYHIPAAASDDTYAIRILNSILTDGDSSRLNQRLVRKDKTAAQAGAEIESLEDSGELILVGLYGDPANAPKIEAAIKDEVKKVTTDKVGAAELTKAKNQLASTFVFGLQTVDGMARAIGESRMLRGDARAWIKDYDKLQAVTADDVQRVAKTYLGDASATVLVVPPAGGGK